MSVSGKKQDKTPAAAQAAQAVDESPPQALTVEQAAARVQRPPLEAGGKPRPVAPEEVLAWRADGAQVIVVTRDGQKLTGAL